MILSKQFGESDTRLKNKYNQMKRKSWIQTFLILFLTMIVEYGILSFFSVKYKLVFLASGFGICCLAFYGLALRRLTKDLGQISEGLERILDDSTEPILLCPELSGLAEQMTVIQSELLRREKQAAENEQKKKELLVYLAHDLKTPLTSVLAYLTMLDEHPQMQTEERAKYTHITLEKAIRLDELLHEFFDITKFNMQEIVLEKQEIDLSILLEQLADESYGMLQEKQMTCSVDVSDDLRLQADPDKLARVFDNLLRNAAAYGYEKSEIRIQARGDAERITIIFTNQGSQIPQKKLERIFEKFYRADASRSSQTGGAGLGLAIAKQIVELHGGTISAASDRSNTRFIVTLPTGLQQSTVS